MAAANCRKKEQSESENEGKKGGRQTWNRGREGGQAGFMQNRPVGKRMEREMNSLRSSEKT